MTRALLVLAFLLTPAFAGTNNIPPCMDLNVLQAHTQHNSEKVYGYLNIFKAYSGLKAISRAAMEKPCETPGYTRYKGKCYSARNLGFVKE